MDFRKGFVIGVFGILVLSLFLFLNETPTTGQVTNTSLGQVFLCFNQPPNVTAIADQNASAGGGFTLQVNASDTGNQTLTYYDDTTLFDINSTSGLITATNLPAGTTLINITVQDSSGCVNSNVSRSFTLTVIGEAAAPAPSGDGDGGSAPGISPPLFLDTFLDTEATTIEQGDDLTIEITYGELPEEGPVDIVYTIFNSDGEIVYVEEEVRVLDGVTTYDKDFDTADLPPGIYRVNIKFTRAGSTLESNEVFTVAAISLFAPSVVTRAFAELPTIVLQLILPLVLILGLLLLLLVIFAAWVLLGSLLLLWRYRRYKAILLKLRRLQDKFREVEAAMSHSFRYIHSLGDKIEALDKNIVVDARRVKTSGRGYKNYSSLVSLRNDLAKVQEMLIEFVEEIALQERTIGMLFWKLKYLQGERARMSERILRFRAGYSLGARVREDVLYPKLVVKINDKVGGLYVVEDLLRRESANLLLVLASLYREKERVEILAERVSGELGEVIGGFEAVFYDRKEKNVRLRERKKSAKLRRELSRTGKLFEKDEDKVHKLLKRGDVLAERINKLSFTRLGDRLTAMVEKEVIVWRREGYFEKRLRKLERRVGKLYEIKK